MKNVVWKSVPRLAKKSMVTSKWIHKIKHVENGRIKKYKSRLVLRKLSQKRESSMKRNLLQFPKKLLLERYFYYFYYGLELNLMDV